MTAPARPVAADRRAIRTLAGVAGVCALLAVAVGLLSRPERVYLPLDSASPQANGALGLFDAARRLGWRPRRAHPPLARPDPTAVHVAIHTAHGVDAADAGRLLAAVRAGAGLIVDVRADDPLSDSLGLVLRAFRPGGRLDNPRLARALDASDALTRPGCGRGLADPRDGVRTVSFALTDTGAAAATRAGRRVFLDADGRVQVVGWSRERIVSDSAIRMGPGEREPRPRERVTRSDTSFFGTFPVMLGVPLGRGRVVAVADAAVLTNDALRACNAAAGPAAVRALEWVTPQAAAAGRRTVFFLDGRVRPDGRPLGPDVLGAVWQVLTTVPAGRTVAQIVGAALVLLAAAAVRALPPLPARPAQRRSALEHVGALARAYREARATRQAARLVVRGLRRRAGGSARTVDEARFLDAVARRAPAVAADAALLAAAIAQPVAPADLVAVGEAAARVEAALAAMRRGAAPSAAPLPRPPRPAPSLAAPDA